MKHDHDPAHAAARAARRKELAAQAAAMAARQKAAVSAANGANSVPVLRGIVAALADDVARLIDGVR